MRQMAMMSDAISHAILPGIVIAFFLTGSLSSPLLLVGGAATGLVTVVLVEMLRKTELVRERCGDRPRVSSTIQFGRPADCAVRW